MSDTPSRPVRRSSRLTLAVLATCLLMLATAATASAAGSDKSVSSPATGTTPGGAGDGATRVYPDPSVIDLHRQSWDHISVSANGRKLTVYFWMGVQQCNGLGRVDVVRKDGHLQVRLWTGTQAKSAGMACNRDRPALQDGRPSQPPDHRRQHHLTGNWPPTATGSSVTSSRWAVH
jgi:hypothetical protein